MNLRSMIILCVLLALIGWAAPARAHDPSLSGIQVLYRAQDVVITVSTHISRLLRAEGRGRLALTPVELDMAIRRRLHVRCNGKDLIAPKANVIGDNANDLLSWQTILANSEQPNPIKECEVLSRLYPEDPNSRTAVTYVRDGKVIQEALLDAEHPSLLQSEPAATPLAVAARYVREGTGHIFSGPDHIMFVLGLLLLGGSLKVLLKTVTAFTLAHSVTLSLAATGVWNPSPRIIEPLIALSIVAIAVENMRHLWKKRVSEEISHALKSTGDGGFMPVKEIDRRPYYAFGFGLIHGFGFAGALAEVGLPKAALGVALASFNIGVEIGQIAIVLAAFPILAWLAKTRPAIHRPIVLIGSIVIGVAGSYWFFSRLGSP